MLYRDLDSSSDAAFHPVLKRSTSIVELIAWSYFNGIVNRHTRLSLVPGNSAMKMFELRNIIETLEQVAPYPLASVPHDQFRHNNYPIHTVIFVNVGVDPMAELSARGVHKLSDRNDSLGYSSLRDNLVTTLDLITINSWHEISVHCYELGDTVIQCLKNYLASLVEIRDKPLPKLDVRCFCPSRAEAIARRVEALFADVIGAFFTPKGMLPVRYVIEMDRRFFVIQFFNQQPKFTAFDTLKTLQTYLEQPQVSYAPVIIDQQALQDEPRLRLVFKKSKSQVIQVFYSVNGSEAELYIIDEYGSLFTYTSPFHSHQSLLIPLYRFLTSILERRQMHETLDEAFIDLSLEFYELFPGKTPHTAVSKKKDLAPEAVALFVDVQVIGNKNSRGELLFDIYCDQQEFSVIEYGERLIPAVAHYIHSQRASGEFYPCYITDLGLPQGLDQYEYQSDFQTVQYLRYKQLLESKLNQALIALM